MSDMRLATEPERLSNSDRRSQSHQLLVYHANDPGRVEVEEFVRAVFATRHAARVCSFMPTLLALRNDTGVLCSAAGFRCAGDQALFLERYLDEPIERAIASSIGQPVSRAQVVEVGNLAARTCRSAMRLVLDLPRMLLDRGQNWIVFTATDTVRQLLASYRAPLLDLGSASASRARDTGDNWGRYYDTHPRVMAGYLPDGLGLRRHLR